MLAIKHTIFRNNVYHFNIRLGRWVYRKSLKTDSPKVTKKYVSSIKAYLNEGITMSKSELDEFIEMLISNQVNYVVQLAKAATEPLSNTSKSYFNNWYASVKEAVHNNWDINNQNDPRCSLEEIAYPSYNEYLSYKMDKTILADPLTQAVSVYSHEEEDYQIDESHQFYDDFLYPSHNSEFYSFLKDSLDKHTKNMANALREEQFTSLRAELTEIKTKFGKLLPEKLQASTQPLPVEPEIPSTPYFKDIESDVANFIDGNTDIKEKTKRSYKAKFMWIAPALKDYRLSEITEGILEDVWSRLRKLPSAPKAEKYGLLKDYNGKQEQKEYIWSYFDNDDIEIPLEDRLSTSTLKETQQYIVNVFFWAIRKEYIERNPTVLARLSTKGAISKRVPLPIKTVNEIAKYCLDNIQEHESWPVLIMIYHGMRNEEVCSLTTNDIITYSESKVVYMNIVDGKTKNAIRKVPIHKNILKAGFIEYVESKENKLFDTTSQKLTENFNHYRKLFKIPLKTEANELLNLYSLRHNVITQLQNNQTASPDLIYKLVGHGSKNITLNYTHASYLLYQKMINEINYD
jgi:integrase